MEASHSRRCSCRWSHSLRKGYRAYGKGAKSLPALILPALLCSLPFTLPAGAESRSDAASSISSVSPADTVSENPLQASLRQLIERADSGEAEALYQLALLYERGYASIPQDSLKFSELLRQSASLGNLKAQNLLGYQLISSAANLPTSSQRTPLLQEGLYWLEQAALAGDAKAQGNLGYLLLAGEGIEHDASKAAFWLTKASDAGVATASSMLGDLYRDGRGVSADTLRAESLYRRALNSGLADAAYKLEDLMASRWATLPDSLLLAEARYLYSGRAPQLGVKLLKRIANVDTNADINTDSNSDISTDSKAGLNVDTNVDLGSTSSPLAEDETRGMALALLGDAYTRAIGAPYDHILSIRYYYLAALCGNPAAEFVISELLEIFPDALTELADLLPPCSEASEWPESGSMSESLIWRERAAAKGITTAEEATRYLFPTN